MNNKNFEQCINMHAKCVYILNMYNINIINLQVVHEKNAVLLKYLKV